MKAFLMVFDKYIYRESVLRIRIRNRFFPDPGSQTHIVESLLTIFWVKSPIILCKLGQIFFLHQFKNKIIFNFVIFVATKKEGQDPEKTSRIRNTAGE